MKDLKGKNAVLTGGSQGIGPYIARALASEGVNLVLAARSADKLESVAKELTKLGTRVIAIPTDITDEPQRVVLLKRAAAELGQIDILVNNAGVVYYSRFSRQEKAEMVQDIEINLMAPLFLTREVLPDMLERGTGHIVNIASLAGKKGIPYEAVYSASKAGLIEWSNALRLELEGTGVDVSVVCPVYVSKVGMFAVHGLPAPRLAGSSTPEGVANAVIKALKKNLQEVLVRPGPTRPLYALNALSPRLGNLILKIMGVPEFQRKMADSASSKDKSSTG